MIQAQPMIVDSELDFAPLQVPTCSSCDRLVSMGSGGADYDDGRSACSVCVKTAIHTRQAARKYELSFTRSLNKKMGVACAALRQKRLWIADTGASYHLICPQRLTSKPLGA